MSVNRKRGWKQRLRGMTGERRGAPPNPDEFQLHFNIHPRGPRRRSKPVTS